MAVEFDVVDNVDNYKIYVMVLNFKLEAERNRDEVNKYYISLFAALLSFAPIIDKISPSVNLMDKYNMKYALMLISLIGFMLSISWRLNLVRIHNYLQGIDELLVSIERKSKISFVSYMINYLSKNHSPASVIKQQIIIPYGFLSVFTAIFIYSLLSFLK